MEYLHQHLVERKRNRADAGAIKPAADLPSGKSMAPATAASPPAASGVLPSRRQEPKAASGCRRLCRECGSFFRAQRATRLFCSATCRTTFNNRKAARGAALYSLVMALRFARDEAQNGHVWSLLCRMAAAFRDEDERERAARRSWDDLAKVRDRNARLSATVVGVNVAGARSRRPS